MAESRLFASRRSGNACEAALMLRLCGADSEPRFVDYFDGETRTPAYRALDEMGEVRTSSTAGAGSRSQA